MWAWIRRNGSSDRGMWEPIWGSFPGAINRVRSPIVDASPNGATARIALATFKACATLATAARLPSKTVVGAIKGPRGGGKRKT